MSDDGSDYDDWGRDHDSHRWDIKPFDHSGDEYGAGFPPHHSHASPRSFGDAARNIDGGGSASKKDKPVVLVDETKSFSSLAADLIAEEDDSDDEDNHDFKKTDRRLGDKEKAIPDFMFFDFRRGAESFPCNCEIIDPVRSEVLLKKQTDAAVEAIKTKKKDGDGDSMPVSGNGAARSNEEVNRDELAAQLCDAEFEVLDDGSTALVIKPGFRLKLHLGELLDGGDGKREARTKKKLRKKKGKKSKFTGIGAVFNSVSVGSDDGAGSDDDDDDDGSPWLKKKEYINEYTITMDIKLSEKPPREGVALFQTALVHATDGKKSGKVTLSRSEGECIINQAGGVGQFGTFGDTSTACVDTNRWKRVVISVKCGDTGEKKSAKGEMRTWVGTNPGITVKDEAIEGNGRFTIDPDGLFIFSSAQNSMMPGKIAVRTIRVERTFANDEYVNSSRARDKISNIFIEDRAKEIEKQREGLSLASLFAKPRPMWLAQAFFGYYGDSFIGNQFLFSSLTMPV